MTIIPFAKTRQGGCPEKAAWLTLPMAPQAVARIRFCGEEKLPSAVPLHGVLAWIVDLLARGTHIAGLDLNGPGDPLATPALTVEILAGLRTHYPDLPICMTTLGLGLADQAGSLAKQGVARVALLVDAVSPESVENLYAWIRPAKRNTPLAKGAGVLLAEQAGAISACRTAGLPFSIRTSVYAGVNEGEIEKIARLAAEGGAEYLTLLPGRGWLTHEKKLSQPSTATMAGLVKRAGQHIRVACLADDAAEGDMLPRPGGESPLLPGPSRERPNAAVLSASGMDIDLHLGQATKALVYGPREDGLACLLEPRELPAPGCGDSRWQQVAAILKDCFVLLAASAGHRPREILGRHGLPLLLIADNVEGAVDALYGGARRGKCKK